MLAKLSRYTVVIPGPGVYAGTQMTPASSLWAQLWLVLPSLARQSINRFSSEELEQATSSITIGKPVPWPNPALLTLVAAVYVFNGQTNYNLKI